MEKAYKLASSYINGENINHLDVLGAISDLVGTDVPERVEELAQKALLILNKDFEEPITLEEYVTRVESFIEEVSGTLGELLS